MQGFVRSGRLANLILGLAAGNAARAAAQGKTDQPVDLNASGDSTDLNEGLFRIYTARNSAWLRGDFPAGSPPGVGSVSFCGDWH